MERNVTFTAEQWKCHVYALRGHLRKIKRKTAYLNTLIRQAEEAGNFAAIEELSESRAKTRKMELKVQAELTRFEVVFLRKP